jgi:xanthine/uracil permease
MTEQLKRELSLIAILSFVSMLFIVCFAPVKDGAHDLLLVLLGTLVGVVKDVYCFYFGSSSGSQRKTEILNQQPAPPANKQS